jgi:adenylate cyclase
MKLKLYILLVGLAALFSAVILRVNDLFFIETARLKGLDYYQRTQQLIISENIVVIEIDEQSLEKHGQWPWNRSLLSYGIRKAFYNDAAIVVLPMIYAEEDRLGGDEDFIQTLFDYPVITSQSAALKGKGAPVPRGVATIGEGIADWLFSYPAAIGPIYEIGKASAGVGMLLTSPELDGVVRRLPLIVSINKEIYPSLPLEVLRVFGGEQSYQARLNESGIDAVRVPGFSPIKTDANGRVWIHFKYLFETFSFADFEWRCLEGKIVIFALTAEGLANTVATPVGIKYGHEISLQSLQMLIDSSRLSRPAEFDFYEIIFGIIIGIIIIICAIWAPYWISAILLIISFLGPYFLGIDLFIKHGYLLDYTWPIATACFTWSASIFMRFVSEFKQKQQIKKQFGTYLSPAMVEKLQKNPKLLQLGGDSRELSIMFTDVRGFTAISEHYGTNVQGLTKIMNRYMTAMTQAILDNRGTLDKYIGDAQMAFWNAPLDDEYHALHSIETALIMLKNLEEFNDEITKEGVPPFGMGIGINTGIVVVGNMGSTQRFDYTCLGDSVNLASRLEGQSKPYGVKIVLGPITHKYIRFHYPTLELDCIAVKGKTTGVKIYTVFESKTNVDEKGHAKFLELYRNQNWDLAIKTAIELSISMKFMKDYYSMMINRIQDLKKNNIDKNWDGIFKATNK